MIVIVAMCLIPYLFYPPCVLGASSPEDMFEGIYASGETAT